jgi:phage terminase large subunit-like protein
VPHPRLYPLAFPLRDLKAPEDLIPEAALEDPTGQGAEALELASRLRITEGRYAGEFFGTVAQEWQKRLIRAIWGHLDEAGRRIIRRVVLLVSRKAGKTALASILGMTEVLMSHEARGQVLVLAAQRDQSRLTHNNWREMVRADAMLANRFRVVDFQHRLIDEQTGTELKALSTEAGAVIGTGPSVAIIDELHLIGLLGQKGLDLVHNMESGMLARAEPMSIYISTAPVQQALGVYREVVDHARKVLTGELDDRRTLALLYEIPPELDHEDPANWWRSNPSLGTTVQLPDLLEQFQRAKQRGPAAVAEFKSQNLNIEPANRDGAIDVWIKPADWKAAEDASITLETILRCKDVTLGIDAGGANDLTAAVALGREAGKVLAWSQHWISRRGFEEQKNRGPFAEALDSGELVVVPNVGDDVAELLALVRTLRVKLRGVGCDPYGLKEASVEIQKITSREVLGVPQG